MGHQLVRAGYHRDGVELDGAELPEEARGVAMAPAGEPLGHEGARTRLREVELVHHRGHSRRAAGDTVRGTTVVRMRSAGQKRDPGPRPLLEQKRAELLARIEEFGASDPAETSNLNFGKRIGDGTTYAVERMNGAYQARTLFETVTEIDAALERVDAGAYGLCTSCAARIPAERLAAVPWAARCVPCSSVGRRRRA